MRNQITHDYDNLELEIVWSVFKNDLVPLIKSLEDISGARLHQAAEKKDLPDV